jgi:hypothetical protein
MSNQQTTPTASHPPLRSLLIGTGLAVASLILVPAFAQRLGMGSSLSSALRVALMRAAQRA